MRPLAPNDAIGWPLFLSSANRKLRIGHEHAIGVDRDAAMTEPRAGAGAAARIELPDLRAALRIHRHHLHRWRGRIQHPVDDDGIALHFGVLEGVAAVVGPGDLQRLDVALLIWVSGEKRLLPSPPLIAQLTLPCCATWTANTSGTLQSPPTPSDASGRTSLSSTPRCRLEHRRRLRNRRAVVPRLRARRNARRRPLITAWP